MPARALAHSTNWPAFRLDLVTAGLVIGAPMLNVAPIDLSRIRYRVPAPPHLTRVPGGSNWLVWADAAQADTLSPAGGSFLAEFLRLDVATDDRIHKFATARGPIRDTGWEMLGDIDAGDADLLSWRFTEQLTDRGVREPITGWRSKARQLGALLRGAAALQHGEAPTPNDIQQMLYGGHIASDGARRLGARHIDSNGRQYDLALRGSNEGHGHLILLIAAEWVPADDLCIGPERDREAGSMRVGVQMARPRQPLVSLLGLELMAALSSPVGIWSCEACSYPYTPARVPRADRKRFCPTCSEGRAAARIWWRQHRSKRGKEGQSDG
ncbi:MAG: hypothetical protein M3P18_18100 [Actinomycetota bacterium]|nr:hypothetical protein [Actinomycetota bacterium]